KVGLAQHCRHESQSQTTAYCKGCLEPSEGLSPEEEMICRPWKQQKGAVVGLQTIQEVVPWRIFWLGLRNRSADDSLTEQGRTRFFAERKNDRGGRIDSVDSIRR